MRSVTVRLDDLRTTVLNLGFVGENEHTQIRIDSKKMYDQYPTASASLTVCPPEGESYPAVIERDGDFVLWTITDSDLTHEGSGEIQLSFTISETVAKSYIGRFKVSRSIVPTGEIPEGIDDFLTRAGAALTSIPETIDTALAEAKASGEFDGPQGPAGQDGTDGQDGFSPTATVTKSGKIATITITDKDGTTTAQISDGEGGGDPTAIIDDTAGEGDTNKVWSADKSYAAQQSVLTEITNKAEVRPTEKSGVDLDITDANGNVIVRMKNGHIQTKKFNSENAEEVKETTADADLDLVDENLNVLARFENGHIRTKYFESRIRTRMEFGAHNGAEYYAPECSIPAYRIAGQQGWEWAWIAGIWFSSEGTMYVMHDSTVDRTTDGTGTIAELTDEYIDSLHIDKTGSGYDLADFSQEDLVVPTFEQILQICVRYNMKMVIRMNNFPYAYSSDADKAKWDGLMNLLKAYNVSEDDVCFYIDSTFKGNQCRTMYGNNVCLAYFGGQNATAQTAIDWFADKELTGNLAHIINHNKADLNGIKLLHSNGIKAFVYDVASYEEASLMADRGADICQNGKIYRLID